jgi:hypothetical protein
MSGCLAVLTSVNAPAAGGPVAFDAAGALTLGAASATYDYTNLTAGTATALIAIVQAEVSGGTTVDSVVWDQGGSNQSMTFIGRVIAQSTNRRTELWGLVSPAAGNKTMRVTLGAPATCYMCAASFTGSSTASVAAAFTNVTTNQATAATTIDVVVTSGATHIVVAASTDDTGSPSSVSMTGAGDLYLNNAAAVGVVAGYDTGSASKTMTATYTGNGNLNIIGVSVTP